MVRQTATHRTWPDTTKPFSFWERLKEIDMFFQGNDPVHKTLRRTVKRLEKAGIPYAIVGAMAVNAHGQRRTTDDIDLLLSSDGLQRFRDHFVPKQYAPVPGRPRRFVDRLNGVTIDVLETGRFPGTGKPGPVAYPDPQAVGERIEKALVVNLPTLIQLRLAARRYYDFGDVVNLIRVHDLDESYLPNLHPSLHQDFIECLEEKRREDEYIARNG